jgi:AcrR family transcriptional regulator
MTTRDRLLAAAVDYVAEHGVGELSLRPLAAALGTSHRMLIYHFGSKEGLLIAIVHEVERRQRDFFSSVSTDSSLPPREAGLKYWRQVTDPRLDQNIRLFFELYGQAIQGRPGMASFLDGIIDSWIDPLTEYGVARGVPLETARADARLSVAVTRGLLLDLVATGDKQAVDQAYARYLQLYERLLASG